MKKVNFTKKSACLILCMLIVSVNCLCAQGCIPKAKYERIVRLSEPLPAGGSFEAQTHNGYINLTGAAVADCNLIATITARAETEENAKTLAEATEIMLVPSGNKLTVKIEKPDLAPDECINVDLDVTVPNKTNLDLKTHNGEMKIENLTGQIAGTTHNGTINCNKVAGNIQLQTHNGSVICEEASGDMKLRTHNGNAKAVYSESSPAVCNLSMVTHNGSVSVNTPQKFSAKVEASTHNGSITTDLPITVTGEVTKEKLTGNIGTGEGTLYLETHNGSISIK